ncbi:PASTA domain-containing protein [Nocardioides sp. C4-1]|uniref:PASTA domain-containing protein n=1 Tax=Nocardioides sp. C4-1 TaxID=3151851 RepID=UPI0032660CB8
MQPDARAAGAADPMRGRLLDGRYRIGPRIARGGMASVYEAVDERLDRTVAVKIMHAGLSDSDSDRDFAERFVREARAAARLSHPHVVGVHDQGDDDGTVFLVMELVSGHTLRDTIVKESPMPPRRALELVEPVLSALASAHRAGIVHRDIKPENVLIADDGRVKVADFGLAKAVSADTQHTATQGVLIGTVSYLAPELVVDGRSDARADVYAVGVLLYELLTGVKPHEGESPIAVAYKHVHHDVPPPSERVPGIPAYVDALVARATARDRTRRPADAAVLLHQVHRVAHAVDAGVRDDPELTQDLSPFLGPVDTGSDADTDDALPGWESTAMFDVRDVASRPHEHTTALPLLDDRPPPPPVLPRRGPDVAHAPPPRPRRRRRGLLLLVVGLVLALAVGGGAFWYGWARYSPAPTVVGSDQATAVAAIEDAGLEVAYTDPVHDSEAPEGTVVAADPRGGEQVLDGDTVTLTLSLGPLFVPELRELDEDAAQDALQEAGLVFGESTEQFTKALPAGSVLRSDPPSGTEVEPGTAVDLVLSKGPKPLEVGDWVGRPYDDAEAALTRRGLAPRVVEEVFDDEVPAGSVVSHEPAGGTLTRGDGVAFVVSKGPELVEVPRVYSFGVQAAEDAMREAGFDVQVEEVENSFGLGFVVRTDPEQGSMAPKGSTITLFTV